MERNETDVAATDPFELRRVHEFDWLHRSDVDASRNNTDMTIELNIISNA
jgi:hypothetical protein